MLTVIHPSTESVFNARLYQNRPIRNIACYTHSPMLATSIETNHRHFQSIHSTYLISTNNLSHRIRSIQQISNSFQSSCYNNVLATSITTLAQKINQNKPNNVTPLFHISRQTSHGPPPEPFMPGHI